MRNRLPATRRKRRRTGRGTTNRPGNRQTFDRERRGLLEAMETFKVKEGTIVTENDSGEMREGKNKIVWMPFRQFALNL